MGFDEYEKENHPAEWQGDFLAYPGFGLYFSFRQEIQFLFPVSGVDGAQGIVGQQPVLHHQCGHRAGAGGVEEGIVPHAEAAGNEKLRALFCQQPGLDFGIAHGFMGKVGLHLLELQLFFAEATGLAADAVELEALLVVVTGNQPGLGIEADTESHAQLLVAHGFGEFRRFLQAGDVAVERALHIGGGFHDLPVFLAVGRQYLLPVKAGAVHAFGIAGMGLAIGAIGFHGMGLPSQLNWSRIWTSLVMPLS